jgi:hypothetical protein
MVIQRSTFEFLLITLIFGSIMAATLWLGAGAGVLLLIGWGIAGAIYLKRKGKRDAPSGD